MPEDKIELPKRDVAYWMAQGRESWAKSDRSNRLGNARLLGVEGAKSQLCNDGEEHRWQPLSFRFECQLLDGEGRVRIRQPDLKEAQIYLLCMGCRTWTYVVAEWAGYYLGGVGEGFAGPDPVLSLFDEPEDPDGEDLSGGAASVATTDTTKEIDHG